MGWKYRLDLQTEVDAPQQQVWDLVSDHERVPEWVTRWVRRVTVRTPGAAHRNGLGAIRGLKVAGWPEALEEVVMFEAPHRYQYEGPPPQGWWCRPRGLREGAPWSRHRAGHR